MSETLGSAIERLREGLPGGVFVSPEDRRSYAFDAGGTEALPDVAVVPRDVREVAFVVRVARETGLPLVPRGAGTGLCGAAVPVRGGIVVSFARMNRVLALDVPNRRARVQPGLVNIDLSAHVAPHGLFFAPDPSSQRISTLGGNVATNAGGPHSLAYGTTAAHVLGLEYVDADGEVRRHAQDDPGYDLTGVLIGSEGTLGIVTAIDVRLVRLPAAVQVVVAAFGDVESASACVSATIGSGCVPTALEIMDRTIVRAVEAHYHAGYPTAAGAVLLVEFAGAAEDVAAGEAIVRAHARANGALSWRAATSAGERDALWASRKGAAGAVGRLAPNYYIQDATVPRTRLPEALARIEAIARERRVLVGNVFHAGDGNLHPLMLFDRREPEQVRAVAEAGTEILRACIDLGGTISGEHGIGYEKRETLPLVFSASDLAAMGNVRDAWDPKRLFNPDKIFPSDASCGEVRTPPGGSDLAAATEAGAWT